MQISVNVWGKPLVADVHQRSRSVWIATVEYLGKSYTAQGRSPTQAAAAAAASARYATN